MVTDTTFSNSYVYTGLGNYEISFSYDVPANVIVQYVNTGGELSAEKVLGIDYNIIRSGATVYCEVLVDFGTDGEIYIYRSMPLTQTWRGVDGTEPAPSAIMQALDRLTWMIQQVKGLFEGALRTPINEVDDMTIPNKIERANSYFYYGPNGEPTYQNEIIGVPTSAFGAELILSADSAAARELLGLAFTANTTISILPTDSVASVNATIDAMAKNLGGYILTLNFEAGAHVLDSWILVSGFINGTVLIKSSDATSISMDITVGGGLNVEKCDSVSFSNGSCVWYTNDYTPISVADINDLEMTGVQIDHNNASSISTLINMNRCTGKVIALAAKGADGTAGTITSAIRGGFNDVKFDTCTTGATYAPRYSVDMDDSSLKFSGYNDLPTAQWFPVLGTRNLLPDVLTQDTTVSIASYAGYVFNSGVENSYPKNLNGHSLILSFDTLTETYTTGMALSGFHNGELSIDIGSTTVLTSDDASSPLFGFLNCEVVDVVFASGGELHSTENRPLIQVYNANKFTTTGGYLITEDGSQNGAIKLRDVVDARIVSTRIEKELVGTASLWYAVYAQRVRLLEFESCVSTATKEADYGALLEQTLYQYSYETDLFPGSTGYFSKSAGAYNEAGMGPWDNINYSSSRTQNQLFDALSPYVPEVGNKIPVTGVADNVTSGIHTMTWINRETTTLIFVYGMLTNGSTEGMGILLSLNDGNATTVTGPNFDIMLPNTYKKA